MNKDESLRDIAEIRSMMERSSRFLSLSGWAGIMAGLYALAGAWIAYSFLNFHPVEIYQSVPELTNVILLAVSVLLFSLVTAIYFSRKKATASGEKVWNATTRRLLVNMAIPLVTGGVLILILISKELIGLIVPFTLIFYGLSLVSAGNFTLNEVKLMGIIQIVLGLLNVWHLEAGLLFWVAGFGLVHIMYGVYMHKRYER
ncbi:hypothetical protein DYD21_08980 [Rhodohalobacter sp. SW132]|uniref:hypothetical protein n=1 Tax=Rhodohalobacter sp. SW132 TaxID=2293433 RepID=UPI000E21DB6A|nr:hypothetical protein [Rhodohalobacter sp. SW132]REL37903.1 hypothetical protein DYD21_08980 [Rhodohalobacter sp. SW132]